MTELRDEIKTALEDTKLSDEPIDEKMLDVLEAIVIAKRIKLIDMDHMEEIRVKTLEAFILVGKASGLLDEVREMTNSIEDSGELNDADIQSKLHSTLETLDYMVDDDHNDEYSCEYCIEKKAQKIVDKLSEYSYA